MNIITVLQLFRTYGLIRYRCTITDTEMAKIHTAVKLIKAVPSLYRRRYIQRFVRPDREVIESCTPSVYEINSMCIVYDLLQSSARENGCEVVFGLTILLRAQEHYKAVTSAQEHYTCTETLQSCDECMAIVHSSYITYCTPDQSFGMVLRPGLHSADLDSGHGHRQHLELGHQQHSQSSTVANMFYNAYRMTKHKVRSYILPSSEKGMNSICIVYAHTAGSHTCKLYCTGDTQKIN